MTVPLTLRAKGFAVGLAALVGVGAAVTIARQTSDAVRPTVEAPACSSCSARHARLTRLPAAFEEGTK
jgi:hypothetical protein